MDELIFLLYSLYHKCPVISTDSRKITPGCLFFGLKGEHVDGSDYGARAVDLGASVAIVRPGTYAEKQGVIVVEEPLEVLQQLAQHHRNQLKIPVLAITGSNGKTTTKELIFGVLSSTFLVRATQGNLNNHIGVPLTILSIKSTDQVAIVEMGANHPGEINLLCRLAHPTHGIVTNIGKAHLEGFGGIEGVKRAKSELYDSIRKSGGVAFVNRNEAFLTELSDRVSKKIFYGFDLQTQYSVDHYRFTSNQWSSGCSLSFRDAQDNVWIATSALFGEFNLANIATAIAIGLYFEIEGSKICDAISSYIPDNNRAQYVTLDSNTFILDAYNANPTSMISAIKSFASIKHPCKFMILGAMMELGEYSASEHLEIARLAAGAKETTTIFIGVQFKIAADYFHMQWYAQVEDLIRALSHDLPEEALILIKGSRAMHLESLLTAFQ
ncbi:MAG TPA: UDP-N-acetylmuramoyl-tripeptide--D-alanyl-D-alanine ligase [Saprospiraceae bacterium]|nr:UDP-N-acetylmuramoyl-tripeptide--D-alanyl-D-alanine ligase [Saprospiraceae bacterium]